MPEGACCTVVLMLVLRYTSSRPRTRVQVEADARLQMLRKKTKIVRDDLQRRTFDSCQEVYSVHVLTQAGKFLFLANR